jgi:putative flippase GtrA
VVDPIKKVFIYENYNAYIQFLRYAVVGGIAAVVDVAVFHITANGFGFSWLAAKSLSFICGLMVNYFLSRQWVFNKKERNFYKEVIPFSVIGVIGLLISFLILYILIDLKVMSMMLPLLSGELKKTAANAVAIFLVLFWNFIARKKIVFNDR